MHIVEVRRNGGDVAEPMGRMRNWLDAHRIAPQLFHLHQTVFRPGVAAGTEATAFARAFGGRLVAVSDAPAA